MEKINTYSVIAIFHGNVEQVELEGEVAALRAAKQLVAEGGRCVEIYDTSDALVWASASH